jgi:hypothetical protein
MDVPQSVTGINSVPIGPTDLGTFRAAMAFTPSRSGKAQLLSMRGQCVGIFCANAGSVSIQSDAGGKPSGTELGRMGFYVLENPSGLGFMLKITGNPTDGSFRLRFTDGSRDVTSRAFPLSILHDNLNDQLRTNEIPIGGLTHGALPNDPFWFVLIDPGSLSVTDVALTGGNSPTITLTRPVIEEECGTLSPSPQLTAGTKYWAVMSADDEVGWNDWTNTTAEVLESLDNGPWQPAFNPKTLALRIDEGADTCQPVAVPNPVSGTTIGEMYVHSGAQTFNTVTVLNTGVAPLTLGGVSFTGADAAVFSVADGEPGPLARPFRFPNVVGVGSTPSSTSPARVRRPNAGTTRP